MCGWCSDAASWASARKRRRNAASSASAACSTLTATRRRKPGVLGDVHATARAGADAPMQQVPAREDAAREVAHDTSGHGDTVVAVMPHNVARSAQPGTSASEPGADAATPLKRLGAGRFGPVALRPPKHPERVAVVAIGAEPTGPEAFPRSRHIGARLTRSSRVVHSMPRCAA